ncbi:MAG: hypothetical protein AVO33_06745 [delta proteobacterium ML8_F1]|nr:MAG: hypothetical protein AVO33_06745 [delta proteobacterium ML8_F1]
MTKVKICGIQDIATARIAREGGADYLGFVFARSSRRVSPRMAREIIADLPGDILKVGVFVNAPLEEVLATADFCGLDLVQLHGQERYGDYRRCPYPVVKSVTVKPDSAGDLLEVPRADYLLFDTYHKTLAGGSGSSFNWKILKDARVDAPYFLAGGLSVHNVSEAVFQLRPYGVDVSSGVETRGIKDPEKIIAFIKKVKGSEASGL